MKKVCIRSLVLGIGIGLIVVAAFNLFLQSKSNPLLVNAGQELEDSNLEKSLQNIKNDINNGKVLPEEGITGEDAGNNINIPVEKAEVEPLQKDKPPFEIKISKGMTSETIAELLVKNGVIDNRQDFIDLAIELKMTKQFKYGIKQVPYGSSMVEIIEILTKID